MVEEPEDYRRLLDDAIGSSPPSSIDVDAVITGERRRNRRRHTAAGASAAVVVAAIGLIVAALLPARSAPQAAHRGSGPVPAPSTRPSATPTSKGPPPPASTMTASATLNAGQADRLWPDLLHSIDKMIPDARPLPPQQCGHGSPTGSPLTICHQNSETTVVAMLQAYLGAQTPYYFAAADVPAADGMRGLFIIIQRAGPQHLCPSSLPPSHCSTSIGPGGDQVFSITDLKAPWMPMDASVNVVSVRHADGTEVIATAQNWAASANSVKFIEAKHPGVAIPELREIAITPQISLTH